MSSNTVKPLIIQADTHMRDYRALVKDVTHSKNLIATITSKVMALRDTMDLRLYAHVMQKQFPTGTFNSLMHIASTFYTDVLAVVGKRDMPPLPKGWKLIKTTAATGPTGSSVTAADGIDGFGTDGPSKEQVIKDLANRGAVVGSTVLGER